MKSFNWLSRKKPANDDAPGPKKTAAPKEEAAGGFKVDIRSIHEPSDVLQTLSFDTREDFAAFARTQNIRPDGYYDLRGKDLSRLDLSGAHFIIADLHFANLTEAKLTGADLMGANLTSAMLVRADLTGAETATANVGGADLKGTVMTAEQLYLTSGTPAVLPSGESTPPKKKKNPGGPGF